MEHDSLLASPNDDNNGRKQQKGSTTPLLVVVSTAILLLGLVFYGGDYLGSPRALGVGSTDAHLRHGEIGMTNAATVSSSMSLVGSDTAASDLKTLTIAVDDDELIDGLLSGWLHKGGGNAGGDVIPIGGLCYGAPEDCVIPLGLTHPNCLCSSDKVEDDPYHCFCESGQPGAPCYETSDCVKPPGLEHPVCRTDGKSRTTKSCQSGQPGSLCGQTSDCVVPPGLDHAVCRKDRCQQ